MSLVIQKSLWTPALFCYSVHLRIEEKLSVVLNRDGGVESFDLHGMMYNKVFEDRFNRVAIYLKNHLRSAHPQVIYVVIYVDWVIFIGE